ncbi:MULTISPECIES: DUF805 domain-containing protein [Stenotrophomonas]|uniref:DUF805 domain-containing protein n=1 Tax=Stenotrophomonas TaxID=40323 RepID=UPI00289C13CA|nr:DUF805 domain-containing protein [Stenotrophomonas sp.]
MEYHYPSSDSARFFFLSVPMHKMMIPLTRYTQFSGRASRSEFWWFQLFVLILFLPVMVLGYLGALNGSNTLSLLSGGLNIVLSLGLFLPMISVAVRRLHDTDRSGWWYLLAFIPIIGLVMLVFMLLPGTPGDNRFGAPVPHM